jgi:hypothetical protein
MSKEEATQWVRHALARTRGRELVGNYNPLVVGELFWEQSSKWQLLAVDHIERVAYQCSQFLKTLLHDKCPKDIESRLWDSKIHSALKKRSRNANKELTKIMEDITGYPINYNHYYTDMIKNRRQTRQRVALSESLKEATTTTVRADDDSHVTTNVDVEKVVKSLAHDTDQDMEKFSCDEALDCLLAIYKVSLYPVPDDPKLTVDNTAGSTKDIYCKHHNPGHRTTCCTWTWGDLLADHCKFLVGHGNSSYCL